MIFAFLITKQKLYRIKRISFFFYFFCKSTVISLDESIVIFCICFVIEQFIVFFFVLELNAKQSNLVVCLRKWEIENSVMFKSEKLDISSDINLMCDFALTFRDVSVERKRKLTVTLSRSQQYRFSGIS